MGLLSGVLGESLFCEPLLRYFRQNPLPELFQKTAALKDDRLLAIVTALIVEDRLDAALGSFLPRYSRLTKSTDFSFSKKIALAEALALIPPNILSAASIIRKVRNEFAHHLEIESFTQVENTIIAALKNLRAAVYGKFGKDERKPKPSLVEEYNALGFFCIAGLDAYCENLAYLRAYINTPEFIDSLMKKSAAQNEAEMQAVVAEGPITTETHNGYTVKKYAGGLVRISGEGGGTIDLGEILK